MNKTLQQLDNFKNDLNIYLDNYFIQKKQEAGKTSKLLSEMIDHIQDLSRGGKRIRAAYIYFGYIAFGGKQKRMILELSSFIELIHCYFLIHDDIMDQDSTRRGIPTMHTVYKNIHLKKKYEGDAKLFSESMAILAGDLTSSFAYDVLAGSKINIKLKNKILEKIDSLILSTIAGQMFDISLEAKTKFTKKNIFQVYEYKTAQYTVESPLQIGAIAAGKHDPKTLKILSNYAIPLGVAFQIQDDILGIFGDEKKLGKPVGSDIRENKKTILTWRAREKADEKQQKILDSCLGNKKLTKKQIDDFRQVIIDTGSLDYAKNEAKNLLKKSLNAIKNLKLVPEGKDFLVGIAEYLINREY